MPNRIYCLETKWYGTRDTTTVEPALDLLHKYSRVSYLHFTVATRAELELRLEEWVGGPRTHPILYLGFHGERGRINLETGEEFSLDDLSEILDGACNKRVIHFGSCSTLAGSSERLRAFRERTGAVALLGYGKNVDWLDAIAFEVLLLGRLQEYTLTPQGMMGLDTYLDNTAKTLRDRLGFRIYRGQRPRD